MDMNIETFQFQAKKHRFLDSSNLKLSEPLFYNCLYTPTDSCWCYCADILYSEKATQRHRQLSVSSYRIGALELSNSGTIENLYRTPKK